LILQPACSIAFKEWAAVCESLAAGRQSIILRKGGIREGPGGFAPAHSAFWLYPTNFHQAADSLTPDTTGYIKRAAEVGPAGGSVRLNLLAEVQQVRGIDKLEDALSLSGLHIWSEAEVRKRFCYRRPGLFLFIVRIWSRTPAWVVAESPAMAGCKSWVSLPQPLPTTGLTPALSKQEFDASLSSIQRAFA
jgi:hypothetical protein